MQLDGAAGLTAGDVSCVSGVVVPALGPVFAACDTFDGVGKAFLGASPPSTGWSLLGNVTLGAATYISLAVDTALFAAFRKSNGEGVVQVYNGAWADVATFSTDASHIALTFPSMYGVTDGPAVVAFADGIRGGKATVMAYDGNGGFVSVGRAGFSQGPVTDVSVSVVPDGSSELGLTMVAYIDTSLNQPFVKFFNDTSNAWEDVFQIPVVGTASNLVVRFKFAFPPLVAFSDSGNNGKGTILLSNGAGRRRSLSSTSGLAGMAASMARADLFESIWVSLPAGSASFTPGAASWLAVDVVGDGALVAAYRDGAAGGKLSCKIFFDKDVVLDFGTPGFTPGGGTHLSLVSSGLNVFLGFRDESQGGKLSIYKQSAATLFDWYAASTPPPPAP